MTQFLQLEALLGPAILVWLVLRKHADQPSTAMEMAGASLAIGIGITSVLFFLWRLIGFPLAWYPVFDGSLQVLLGCVLVYAWRIGSLRVPRLTKIDATTPHVRAAVFAACAIVLGICILRYFLVKAPYGDWDGWAIWNLRAEFLAVPTERWRDGFLHELAWSHPDYPLLIPASVSRLWSFGDSSGVFAPRLLAVAAATASSLVLAGSAWRLAGAGGAALSLALLGVPHYLFWTASQTADVPLGLYLLLAVTSLSLPADRGRYIVAGFAAGFAAWTKNEGLVITLLVVLIAGAQLLKSHGCLRDLMRLCIGLMVGGFALLLFKVTIGPASDLMHQILTQGPLEKATQAARHVTVAKYMTRELWAWGGWAAIPVTLVLAICMAFGAFRWRQVSRHTAIGACALTVIVGVYYWIYVLSPYDLEWHLRTSWARLIAQIWPTLVWTAILGVSSIRVMSAGVVHGTSIRTHPS